MDQAERNVAQADGWFVDELGRIQDHTTRTLTYNL
jgi:hypothetical protein